MTDPRSPDRRPLWRAQILDLSGAWLDGTLCVRRQTAEQSAERLAARYGQPTRVVEVERSERWDEELAR
ncbi:MAG: hypothetical protein U5R31_02945 [Acidimicrobiia bacterium]|nr:hypothetical protein [Acidimicrobiia bacterium]